MRREEALACSLIQKYGISAPPVPVEEIAKGEGAVIVRHHFEGSESGFILRGDGQVIIGVNTRTSRKRQRFTIAHELGHLKMHEGKLIVDHSVRVDRRDDVSSIGTDKEEIEANAFGAALLMPQNFVIDHVRQFASQQFRDPVIPLQREALIAQLARDFDVSAEAMGFRLINLGILAA
jgi:Zn-dependent peptidase ImmA (M78 family)